MSGREECVFVPDTQRADAYDGLYEQYAQLHGYFGRGSTVLHQLWGIRDEAERP
jgi:L-ribulokinase